jgi:ankyrin repeat protein
MRAAVAGHDDTVRLLLDRGANVNVRATRGQTALILAASTGHLEIVKALVAKHADLNAKGGALGLAADFSALTWATKRGYEDVVAFLRKKGAR